jgi:hypothetical protein
MQSRPAHGLSKRLQSVVSEIVYLSRAFAPGLSCSSASFASFAVKSFYRKGREESRKDHRETLR